MNNNEDLGYYWDLLLKLGVSEQTLQIVSAIEGYDYDTFCNILYVVAGYNDFSQLDDEKENIIKKELENYDWKRLFKENIC